MHPLRSAGLGTLFRSQDHDVFPLLSSVAAEEADAPGSFPVKSPEPNVTLYRGRHGHIKRGVTPREGGRKGVEMWAMSRKRFDTLVLIGHPKASRRAFTALLTCSPTAELDQI